MHSVNYQIVSKTNKTGKKLLSLVVISLVEETAGCLTLIVLLLSCEHYCSVSLPCCAMDWSVIVAFPGHTLLLSDNVSSAHNLCIQFRPRTGLTKYWT